MLSRPRRVLRTAPFLQLALAGLVLSLPSCRPPADDTGVPTVQAVPAGNYAVAASAPPSQAFATVPLREQTVRRHLMFLADDAQEGRAPGSPADHRVQEHIREAMMEFGLEPGTPDGFRQTFQITNGVRPRAKKRTQLVVGKFQIPHSLVPFAHDTGNKPVRAKLMFVGYGIPGEGKNSGDYADIGPSVAGKIVVALDGGPDDPHLDPSSTRPQTKLIAARDHGAVGFILWEPDSKHPFPNRGTASDLEIPALSVGRAGSESLRAALGGGAIRKATATQALQGLERGAVSRGRARMATPIEPVRLETANIIGRLQGGGSGKTIVVGAHMDHLGLGGASSLAPGEQAIHNGADDNASGVAVMLALAEAAVALPQSERPHNLVFVAFGAEEMGLLGSKYMVKQLSPEQRRSILAMINFDMVGRLGDDGLVISGSGTSSSWPDIIEHARGDMLIKTSEDGFGASDQTSFYEIDRPVLHLFSGTHGDYHRPSDDIDKINFPGAVAIGDVAARIIGELMQRGAGIDFVKVKRTTPKRGGFRVSLGTVPDYAADVDGLRLSGVRPQSPADLAGLQKGDIIQNLGGREIHGMDDYMAAFATMKPGVEIPVQIDRGGSKVTLKITPAAPKRR